MFSLVFCFQTPTISNFSFSATDQLPRLHKTDKILRTSLQKELTTVSNTSIAGSLVWQCVIQIYWRTILISILTWLQSDSWGNSIQFLVGARFFSSPKCSDQLWAQQTSYSKGNKSSCKDTYEANIVKFIKLHRLRWHRHSVWLNNERRAKQIVTARKKQKKRERPQKRWIYEVEENLQIMGIINCHTVARHQKECKRTVLEAKVHNGLWYLRWR